MFTKLRSRQNQLAACKGTSVNENADCDIYFFFSFYFFPLRNVSCSYINSKPQHKISDLCASKLIRLSRCSIERINLYIVVLNI